MGNKPELPGVLVYSSGNPAATLITASLLRARPADFGAVVVQGIDSATADSVRVRVLGEI